jgi:hypothetical protein
MTSTQTLTRTYRTRQIAPDFVGVTIDGVNVGHIVRAAEGWMAQVRPTDAGSAAPTKIFNSPVPAAAWIAGVIAAA